MLVCVFLCTYCTRDRGCSAHPVFPAPSDFRGRNDHARLGRIVPRERETMPEILTVIASEAKQSISPRQERMDCFVASAPRNDDTPIATMTPHSRGAVRPRFCRNVAPKNTEGAGKTGCALHPRSRVQCAFKEKRTRAYRFSGNTPAFPAQWFYGL